MAYDSKGTLNKVMLIGRLGQDPELKYTASGVAVCNLSIATNTSWKGQDGAMNENTEWHRVILWRKLAENIEKYAKKGHRVYVEGRVINRSWQDKDGVKRYTTEIQADSVQLLESRGAREGDAIPEAPPLPSEPHFNEPDVNDSDDLPF